MYRITNIAASREEGCWHHNPLGFSPDSHTLQFEPWISGMQLKLYETRVISDKDYEACKDYLEELFNNRIVKSEALESDYKPEIKVKPVVIETTQTFDLSVSDSAQKFEHDDLPRTKKRK